MKFKHILFSGLMLSATLTACTNEDFEVNGAQDITKDAISLGEGLTISAQLSGAASTKAIYEDATSGTTVNIKSQWENTDSLGGAWYAAYTGTTAGVAQGFLINTDKFGSNHPYSRVEKNGVTASAEFETVTNAFAGKYAIYYPYDGSVAAVSNKISVKGNTAQEMDVKEPLKHVNENIFFYNNDEYLEGGNQVKTISLSPVPVLYRINFLVDENARGLVGKTISMVVVEGDDNTFYSEGALTVDGTAYEDAVAVYGGDDTKTTNVYTLAIVGNENNTDYQVSAVGASGVTKKPFYLSMLPAKADIENLTFKVVTTEGKVYQRSIVLSNQEAMKEAITKEGGLFAYNITLDEEGEAMEGVYTEQQFRDEWDAIVKGTADDNKITLGAPLKLDELTLSEDADITIEGAKLEVNELALEDGSLIISDLKAENVTVGEYGELTVSSGDIEITGTLSVDNEATIDGTVVLNNISVSRNNTLSLTAKTGSKVTGTFTVEKGADVTLSGEFASKNKFAGNIGIGTSALTLTGETTLDEDGVITVANGETLNFGKKEAKGSFTNNGELDIQSDATSVTFWGATQNNSTITVGKTGVNNGNFTNNGTLTLDAGLTNGGTMTLNVNPAGNGFITNNGTLEVKAADVEKESATAPANLKVTNTKTVNISLPTNTSEITVSLLTNNGIVNIAKGVVKEGEAQAVSGTGEINVAKNCKIEFNSTANTGFTGYLIIADTKDNAINGTSSAKVANNYSVMGINGDADHVIIDKTTSLTEAALTKLASRSIVLRANVELQGDLNLGTNSKSLAVEAEIELTGKDSERTLTLHNDKNGLTVSKNGLLKVGNGAKVITGTNTNADAKKKVVAVGGEVSEN